MLEQAAIPHLYFLAGRRAAGSGSWPGTDRRPKLDREFAYRFRVEAVLWEREPLVVTHHFQDPENIPEPRGMDVVVVVLWSQLGVLLPEDRFRGAISGRPVTGTEWEFEDALASARERGVPSLLLYRKTARVAADLDHRRRCRVLKQRRAQRTLVQDFIGRWFRAPKADWASTAASHAFDNNRRVRAPARRASARAAGAPPGVAAGGGVGDPLARRAPFRALLSYEY